MVMTLWLIIRISMLNTNGIVTSGASLLSSIRSHLAPQPHRILASRACFSVVVSQRTRQERMMWGWVRLMRGKWNMCWDDTVDEDWCLYRRWRVTGRKQHSTVGDIPMNIPPKIFREHSTWKWEQWMEAFDAICCNILSQKSHCNALIGSDEMVYQSKPWWAGSVQNKSRAGFYLLWAIRTNLWLSSSSLQVMSLEGIWNSKSCSQVPRYCKCPSYTGNQRDNSCSNMLL